MEQAQARVCLCVMMNHPYPANLPLLRRIYAGRFSEILFLIPFVRLPDPDVITTYRGSYVHAAYLTDAYQRLKAVECDYFLVVHDDVLLNPALSEATFQDFFALGANDGFISRVGASHDAMSTSVWTFGSITRLLHPKSLVFGTGVELDNLLRYLPSADALAAAFARNGVTGTSSVHFDAPNVRPEFIGESMYRLLLRGLSGSVVDDDAQVEIERNCAIAVRALLEAMLGDARHMGGNAAEPAGDAVQQPFPTVNAAYYTDCYILPRPALDDFCHYVGVASAANLFVEIMAPTILHAVCDRVWTSESRGLDVSGFDEPKPLEWLAGPRHFAIHPFKLSMFAGAGDADALIETLRRMANAEPITDAIRAVLSFGAPSAKAMPGWHDGEPWGVWSAEPEATIPVLASEPVDLTLVLRGPVGEEVRSASGRIRYNGTTEVPLSFNYPGEVTVHVPVQGLVPDADGIARITLQSDRFVVPAEIIGSADARRLGIGVARIEKHDAGRG